MTSRSYSPVKKTRFNLVGETFGKLEVLRLLGSYENKHYWECRCACGNIVEIPTGPLKSGNSKSCGCILINKNIARSTHGMSKTPLYGTWRRMIQRCEDANCSDYKYYGARGISVCDRWHSFALFLEDVGARPDGGTIERVDNDKPYGPDNFKWATRLEQMNNTRRVVRLSYEGETLTISEWARRLGVEARTLNARINKLGYTVDEALTKEVKCGAMLNGKNWRSQ